MSINKLTLTTKLKSIEKSRKPGCVRTQMAVFAHNDLIYIKRNTVF